MLLSSQAYYYSYPENSYKTSKDETKEHTLVWVITGFKALWAHRQLMSSIKQPRESLQIPRANCWMQPQQSTHTDTVADGKWIHGCKRRSRVCKRRGFGAQPAHVTQGSCSSAGIQRSAEWLMVLQSLEAYEKLGNTTNASPSRSMIPHIHNVLLSLYVGPSIAAFCSAACGLNRK